MSKLTIEFTGTTCRCGCGTVVLSKKSRFAQGHDARFVSNLRQEAIASPEALMTQVTLVDRSTDPATQTMVSVTEAVEQLGSAALKEKLISGFRKEQGRVADRATREAKAAQAKLDKAAAKAHTPKAGKATGKATEAKSPATQKAEAAATEAAEANSGVDLDTLILMSPGDTVTENSVDGEAPVKRSGNGRTRRGNLQGQG